LHLQRAYILMRVDEFSLSVSVKSKTVVCFLFPLLFFSHFVVSSYWLPGGSFLKCLRFRFLLKTKRNRRVLPEIIFWFVFVLLRRFGLVSLFNKKAYAAGQAVYSKVYSEVNISSYKSFKNVVLLKMFSSFFCAKGRTLRTYWFRFARGRVFIHNFMFRDIAFDERFSRLMNFASVMWFDFNVVVSIWTNSLSVLPVVFFLRDFLKLPLENMRLRDKQVTFAASETSRYSARLKK